MSLLSLIQRTADIAGLARPSSVASSTDATARQLAAYAQMEGDSLARRYPWRQLLIRGTITGDGTSETFTLPNDFHQFVSGTPVWRDGEPMRAVNGPTTDEDWLFYTAGNFPFAFNIWRLNGNDIQIYPTLDDGDGLVLEYQSAYWILDADGTTRKAAWEADTDYCAIPERLISIGTAVRWKKLKGLAYQDLAAEYEAELVREFAANRGTGRIRMSEGPTFVSRRRTDIKVTV